MNFNFTGNTKKVYIKFMVSIEESGIYTRIAERKRNDRNEK